jgi:hypothetical protein
MKMKGNTYWGETTDVLYRSIIQKLNATVAHYKEVEGISQCGESFEVLDQAIFSKDSQVNHLLAITNCLLKYVPYSPYLDELFTNFLKDYIHLANPEMPRHEGEFYLDDAFMQKQATKESHKINVNPYHRRT